MIIKLKKLTIFTKQEPVILELDSISYFYGPISTGKSTIGRLIMHCFGKNIDLTYALQKEFISIQLKLLIGNNDVIIEREKDSSQIVVHYNDKSINDPKSLIVPLVSRDNVSLIPDEEVYNISDLIFYLGGVSPPKVLRSKVKEDSKRIRLGIKDLMWYSYLSQEEMDSSFFYLSKGEDFMKQLKSRDVLRYVLGYYQEEVSKLEEEMVAIREEKASTKTFAQQIRDILEQNNIDDTNKISEEMKLLQNSLLEIERKLTKIDSSIQNDNEDTIKKLRGERQEIYNTISEYENSLHFFDTQIEKQTKLKHEFLTANIRSDRDISASKLFRELTWHKCPECGNKLKPPKEESACPICKQDKSFDSSSKTNAELLERTKELDNSINALKNEKRITEQLLTKYQMSLQEINEKINYLEEHYDSQFLTAASDLLSQKGIIEGKIHLCEKLLPLPKTADDLDQRSYDLEGKLAKVKDQYIKAKKNAEKDKENIELLKSYFLENLLTANFPQIDKNYEVLMNTNNFVPYLKPSGEGEFSIVEFASLGSGGKLTLFKTCFALAIHRVSMKSNKLLPSFLIIDSPMKNIETKQDEEIFKGFHKLIYSLASDELKDLQFIIIGSEYDEPEKKYKLKPNSREFTRDIHSENPPLIPYYEGP